MIFSILWFFFFLTVTSFFFWSQRLTLVEIIKNDIFPFIFWSLSIIYLIYFFFYLEISSHNQKINQYSGDDDQNKKCCFLLIFIIRKKRSNNIFFYGWESPFNKSVIESHLDVGRLVIFIKLKEKNCNKL